MAGGNAAGVVAVGRGVAAGAAVALGVALGVGVAVGRGDGEGVGRGAGVALARGTGVEVARGVGEAVAVAVGVTGGGGATTGGAGVGVPGCRRKLSVAFGVSCAAAGAATASASDIPDRTTGRQFMPVIAPTTNSRPSFLSLAGGG